MSQLFDPSISFSLWGGTKDARLASFVGGDILACGCDEIVSDGDHDAEVHK
jgi:hypothetical protein